MLRVLANRLQRVLGRSETAARVAVKLRNQSRRIIGYHHTSTPDAALNGEEWIVKRVAPSCEYVVDVGANVGRWTKMFMAHGSPSAQFLLYEPSSVAVDSLRKSFADDARIVVHHRALGERAGLARFFEEPSAGETSSLIKGVSRPGAEEVSVQVASLDDELVEKRWPRIDYLKIDAEGFDLHVLRGASRLFEERRVSLVQFEYNSSWALAGSSLGGAVGLLGGCGYELHVLQPNGLRPFCYACFGEYFEYTNLLAVADPSRVSSLLTGTRCVRSGH
jgi:FkbM family methyltransferase